MTTVATTERTRVRAMALDLFEPGPPSVTSLARPFFFGVAVADKVGVDARGGEEARHEGTEGAAHSVDAEGVEGVVVAEAWL